MMNKRQEKKKQEEKIEQREEDGRPIHGEFAVIATSIARFAAISYSYRHEDDDEKK